MPRHVEVTPSAVRKGDARVDEAERIQWTATSDAEVLEDGRVIVSVEYPTPSTLAKSQGTAEWGHDGAETFRVVRRRNV
jgi:hypothetical protein